MTWTTEEAIALCKKLEPIAKTFNMDVALTGGCLYKSAGSRKDVDIVIYKIRSAFDLKLEDMYAEFEKIGVIRKDKAQSVNRFVTKALVYPDREIDFLFPEAPNTEESYQLPEASPIGVFING